MSQSIHIELSDQAFKVLAQQAVNTGIPPDVLATQSLEQQYRLPPAIPGESAEALAAFRRDLPELLQTHAGQWVAYCGDSRIGFHRSQRELLQLCLRQGFASENALIFSVEPESDSDLGELMDV